MCRAAAAAAASAPASPLNAQTQHQLAVRKAAQASVGVKTDVCGTTVTAADG